MRRFFVLGVYNLLFPIFFLLGLPGWIGKMRQRGGFGTGLKQRLGLYDELPEEETQGGIYVHAVSVGEVMIALKLIRRWRAMHPGENFVLVPTTATGHEVAREHACEWLRVVYSPVDFGFLVRKVLGRFAPKAVVLIDSEVWPNLLNQCRKKGIPVFLANARLSPRSGARYEKLRWLVSPVFEMLDGVCVQEEVDLERWEAAGVPGEALVHTGSVKFDFGGDAKPRQREEFGAMIGKLSGGKKVVMLMSSFAGEEKAIGRELWGLREKIFLVVVPRHMERRLEVFADLDGIGYSPVLRSDVKDSQGEVPCLIVDSTGELRDWTAHADVAIIGKSWLEKGGQNPTEAIAARVPLVVGPRMDNFEPFVGSVKAKGGLVQLEEVVGLASVVESLLDRTPEVEKMLDAAEAMLSGHEGATERTVVHIVNTL